jgi:hypothetical protein
MNFDSEMTKNVVYNPNMPVEEFVARYRDGGIWGKLGSELRGKTVLEAITSSSTARKLLMDVRWKKQ